MNPDDDRVSGARGAGRLDMRVANLDCEHDAAALRRALERTPGVTAVEVRPLSGSVTLHFDPEKTGDGSLRQRLEEAGFPPRQTVAAKGPPPPWRNAKVIASLGSGILLLAGWLGSLLGAPAAVAVALYVLAIAAGGYFFGREALEDLILEREVGIELLMAVAAVVAAAMGQPGEGATLVFLYSISEAAEGYTADKTRSAIRALMKLAPRTALVHRDGGEVEVPVEELEPGDVFLVRPGQSVATDGVVETGTTALNEAPVTGESMPVEKGPGDQVLAGTINGQGALEVRATRTFADNTLSRIIRMVEEAQERKGKSQRFVERFGRRYSPAVLAVGALVGLGPPMVAAASWTEWITRATVFIVAAAPCALAISIPITLVAALGTAARKGVLIKGGVHLEELARIRVVALDKTGTLTRGAPELTDVVVLASAPEEHRSETALLAAAAGIERWSEHPLARAIVRGAEQRGARAAVATQFRSHTAAGAEALVQGRRVFVGSPTLFRDDLEALTPEVHDQVQRLPAPGSPPRGQALQTNLYAHFSTFPAHDPLPATPRGPPGPPWASGLAHPPRLAFHLRLVENLLRSDYIDGGDALSAMRPSAAPWGCVGRQGGGEGLRASCPPLATEWGEKRCAQYRTLRWP